MRDHNDPPERNDDIIENEMSESSTHVRAIRIYLNLSSAI